MDTLSEINVFWFKRDLRLFDNEALKVAVENSHTLLLVYVYEPLIWSDDHYDYRHVQFILESLADLNATLSSKNTKIFIVSSELIPFFESLQKHYRINTIFSTEETGLDITFKRDVGFSNYCVLTGIVWKEFQNNGVIRGLRNRKEWRKLWYEYMKSNLAKVAWHESNFFTELEVEMLSKNFTSLPLKTKPHEFQKGGRTEALKWKQSFFTERVAYYSDYISKPEMAQYGCSRLSPYFAWGNLSIREVFQEAMALKKESNYKRQLNAFLSRLRWQSHFIQKFEMEPRMEFEAVNKGFLNLDQPLNENFVRLLKEGKTGYPLVDASIRCVSQTGYINFRMRAMIISFLTHHLFQHFRTVGSWLARQFLDFEPGIHYGQLQMQAGFTGTNTVRVYNPAKNAIDHDSEAVFIKKYVSELAELPINLVMEPWNITVMEEGLYQFKYGIDYPKRIVNISETRKVAVQRLYGQRKSDLAIREKKRILETHTMPRRDK